MSEFIEVTLKDDGRTRLINLDHVEMVFPNPENAGSAITFQFGGDFAECLCEVEQGYETVRRMITCATRQRVVMCGAEGICTLGTNGSPVPFGTVERGE